MMHNETREGKETPRQSLSSDAQPKTLNANPILWKPFTAKREILILQCSFQNIQLNATNTHEISNYFSHSSILPVALKDKLEWGGDRNSYWMFSGHEEMLYNKRSRLLCGSHFLSYIHMLYTIRSQKDIDR